MNDSMSLHVGIERVSRQIAIAICDSGEDPKAYAAMGPEDARKLAHKLISLANKLDALQAVVVPPLTIAGRLTEPKGDC